MVGTANVWHVPDDEGAAHTTHEQHGLIHRLKHRGDPGLRSEERRVGKECVP